MSKDYLLVAAAVVSLGAIQLGSCSKTSNALQSLTSRTWHQKFGWSAEKYFSDEEVIALCRGIEANDLEQIDRLIAAGADVNAKGEGNMTPLLWAFPDNKSERFKRLLEHGADPNVIVSSDFNTNRQGIVPGDSVTHMAARTRFPDHFKYVMEYGGDPNLVHPKNRETPLFTIIKGSSAGKKERIQLLIDKGADLDYVNGRGATAAIQAVSWFGQYDIALMLLKAGADPNIYRARQNSKLIHTVIGEEKRLAIASSDQKKDYAALVGWLEEHGQSVQDARRDLARWASWGKMSFEKMKELREREIAEREARVKAEQKNEQPEG